MAKDKAIMRKTRRALLFVMALTAAWLSGSQQAWAQGAAMGRQRAVEYALQE